MNCPNCGVVTSGRFCQACGGAVTPAAGAVPAQAAYTSASLPPAASSPGTSGAGNVFALLATVAFSSYGIRMIRFVRNAMILAGFLLIGIGALAIAGLHRSHGGHAFLLIDLLFVPLLFIGAGALGFVLRAARLASRMM